MGETSAKVPGRIVIFGASCRIGFAIATALADLRATRDCLYHSNQTAADELAEHIGNRTSVHHVGFAGGYGY